MSTTVRAPAKINLHLGVGPLGEDGFHPLATLYQAVGLYDDVTVSDQLEWSVHLRGDGRIDLAEVDWAAGSEHEPIALYEAGLGVKDVTPASKRPLRER